MNILNLFRSAAVAKPPTYTNSQVSHHAKKFITLLKGVEKTAADKGFKVHNMYLKTEKYAWNVSQSAERENLRETIQNINKLQNQYNKLARATGCALKRHIISAANEERLKIQTALAQERYFSR